MTDNDLRVLRDRQAAAAGLRGRSAATPPAGSARIALQVFDGGSMPTAGDRVFLGHPVAFDAAESEGASWSPVVDADATVPFVALRNPVRAGDVVVATAVGGRWVAEKGGAPRADVLVQVDTRWCGGCVANGIITVTIRSGDASGPIAASGTADADGVYTTRLPPGTYYASASAPGYYNSPTTFGVDAFSSAYEYSPLGPDRLTMTVSGLITMKIYPYGPAPRGGTAGLASYWGSGPYDVPASECCPAATVTLWYNYQCGVGWFVDCGTTPTGTYPCPAAGPPGGNYQGPLTGSTCYPLNLTDTEPIPYGNGVDVGAMDSIFGWGSKDRLGNCSYGGPVEVVGRQSSMTITITQ